MKEITSYQTEDGKIFQARAEAAEHEKELSFIYYYENDHELYGVNGKDAIAWLKTNRTHILALLAPAPNGKKIFTYFEEIEGGMTTTFNIQTANDLKFLQGWDPETTDDRDLLLWMYEARVGEIFEHRLGYLVRVEDQQP